MTQSTAVRGIDFTRRYSLLHGIRLIARDRDSIQIGTDPPRTVVLRHAPTESLSLLRQLDGRRAAGEVISDHDGDPLVWHGLLARLLALDLLVDAGPGDRRTVSEPGTATAGGGYPRPRRTGGRLDAERTALTQRYRARTAERILQARDDAVVVIRGSSTPAVAIAIGLASSGVGHVHHQADRPSAVSSPGSSSRPSTLREDNDVAGQLRRVSSTIRVHAPAAHQCPDIVVLAGRTIPDLGVAASLSRDGIAHLAVRAGAVRAVVGPLVLPGRSSCLSCAHRYRTEADPGWPAVARTLAEHPADAPAFLNAAVAALAVGQVLEHLDGASRPASIGGTLEWASGDVGPRRRTWPLHPDCGCHG